MSLEPNVTDGSFHTVGIQSCRPKMFLSCEIESMAGRVLPVKVLVMKGDWETEGQVLCK